LHVPGGVEVGRGDLALRFAIARVDHEISESVLGESTGSVHHASQWWTDASRQSS